MKKISILLFLLFLTACSESLKINDCLYDPISGKFYKVIEKLSEVIYSVIDTHDNDFTYFSLPERLIEKVSCEAFNRQHRANNQQ
jgi:hypothetical protein